MTDLLPETEGESADESEQTEPYTPWSHDQDAFEPTVIRRTMGEDGLPVVIDEAEHDEALAPPYSPSTFVCMRDESEWYAVPTSIGELQLPAEGRHVVAARQKGQGALRPRRLTPEAGQIIGVYKGKFEDLLLRGVDADKRPIYRAPVEAIEWRMPY